MERKRLTLFVDSLGPCRLELFAVAREIRLRTRRSGVRIPPGAPFHKTYVSGRSKKFAGFYRGCSPPCGRAPKAWR
jgi:hypothetical protein